MTACIWARNIQPVEPDCMRTYFLLISFLCLSTAALAQVDPEVRKESIRNSRVPASTGNSTNTVQGVKNQGPRKDSLAFEHRDDSKDSISITYRFIDSARRNSIDSSVNDFDKYFSVPSGWLYLGNNGQAAHPIVFTPFDKPGWDAGFHAFDLYRFTLEDTRIYKTNRPFSSLSYQLASGKEQMLKAMHTQNPRPNISVGFDYRLISAPGLFVTQNTNHNNYRLYGHYQGKRKRYANYVVLVGNTIRAAENGGIQNDTFLLDPNRKDRFSVPVNLGGANAFRQNPFVTTVNTGNTYRDATLFFRQSYDLGKRDSVAVNDSTTEFLFYPKLRLQHTIQSATYRYQFRDIVADSLLYQNWYDITLKKDLDTFQLWEKWRVLTNDFSIYQFPDTKNTAQFFLAGVSYQQIRASLDTGQFSFYNIQVHGEYRNRTRNKKWDMLLKAEFYVNGLNEGDYQVQAKLDRFLNKKWGHFSLFFKNSNRTPSFIFDRRSSFNLSGQGGYKKENITSFGAMAENPLFTLGFQNHLLTNYVYYTSYFKTDQYSKPINILQVSASKKIKLSRKWFWYLDATLQQTDGAAPVKVPLLFTRNRLTFEGKFFKNLNLSTGLEVRYFTPYTADAYSPLVGKFVPQDTLRIKNLPDIAAFAHFRIKGFTGFIRAENLNTARFTDGFSFTNNNFAAPLYPTQGMIFRFGIQWWFVN